MKGGFGKNAPIPMREVPNVSKGSGPHHGGGSSHSGFGTTRKAKGSATKQRGSKKQLTGKPC